MYFKSLTKLNNELLSEFTDLKDDRFFIGNIIGNLCIGLLFFLLTIISILLIPIALIDHIISGYVYLYKYIKHGDLKKKRIKEVRSIIQEHGNKLLLADKEYILKHNVDNKSYINNKQDSLRLFIFEFLWDLNNIYNTYDHLNQHMICNTRRRRSLGDIFLICKHYYPECTIEDVLTILIKLLNEKDIFASWCTTINKYVFHTDSRNWNRNDRTEYHKDLKFNELIEIYK